MAEMVLFIGSNTTVLNIWDMVGTKVSEQDQGFNRDRISPIKAG